VGASDESSDGAAGVAAVFGAAGVDVHCCEASAATHARPAQAINRP
jgi:hypothetical protein